MSEIAPEPIMQIALGLMTAKHLFVASEIGLFENLAGGLLTLDAVPEATGAPRRAGLTNANHRCRRVAPRTMAARSGCTCTSDNNVRTSSWCR
jgi:hypothetical protein